MEIPLGFDSHNEKNKVCRLKNHCMATNNCLKHDLEDSPKFQFLVPNRYDIPKVQTMST